MRRSTLTAALLSATLLLAACSSDAEEPEPKAEPTPEVVTPETWPLTGLDVADGDDAASPVFVVKIDNTSNAAPQVGLSQADLVFEEMVEGRMTRLAAFFHSALPEKVTPVRSMRATDIGIVTPVAAHVVTSGFADETKARLDRSGVSYIQEGDSAGIFRDSARTAPYNVATRLADVRKDVEDPDGAPEDYFTFGTSEDVPAGEAATSLSADFGNHTTTWTFGNGTYANTGSYAAQGDEFAADNVLVLRVKVVDAGYTDAGRNMVPESVFEGTGEAMLFHGGEVVTGTWTKNSLSDAVTLEVGGEELKVPAGRTWVELLPEETGTVTFE